jgi:hypothetical protein
MPIPASSIFGIYGLEASFTKVLLRELAVLEISLMPSKPFLQATEALLDRIEIWRVWRQKISKQPDASTASRKASLL